MTQHSLMTPSGIGTSALRKEGRQKLTGEAVYVDDMQLPGMLHAATIRSHLPRGRVKGIRFEGDIPWDEFTVVTAQDLPGDNLVKLIVDDQPILAGTVVNHADEPVVLIAHPDRHLVQAARRHVHIDIEPMPAVLCIEDSLAATEVVWGHDNILKRIDIEKGDVDSIWEEADFVVEGEYTTGASEQLYIEPQGMIASFDEEGLTVWGSMQCPYYVHPALCALFDLPAERVRVIQTETGGGFGGKEEYPSIIAGHAALLAWKANRPVKLVYDREEDLAVTTKRHPSRTRHRTAVSRQGRLLAMDVEFILDGGAYVTLSPVVLSRGTIHAAGPYACDNIRIKARAVATNHPPHGAYRGFGNPQSLFAVERHMEKIARSIGMPSDEVRRINFLGDADTTATGQVVRDGVDMGAMMDRALRAMDYHKKRQEYARTNPSSHIKRGVGIGAFYHGSGFTGGGEKKLASVAGLEATPEGIVKVLASSTEIGQGTNTIFSQIVAETLNLPYESVEVVRPDTRVVPNSGPTVASRTAMVVGGLLESAAIGLKQALIQGTGLEDGYTPKQFQKACRDYIDRHGELKTYFQYRQPANIRWSDETYVGDAYASYGWAVYVADVSVDTHTYEARVEDFVALQDVGRVLNPVLAEGQVQGGVAQGIGYALSEQLVYDNGRIINNQMTNYMMPTGPDLPIIRVLFHEAPYAAGPGGAKGVGELPIDGPAPAILNAIEDAMGLSVTHIPATPEILMKEMVGAGA